MNDIFYAYELDGLTPEFDVTKYTTHHEYDTYKEAMEGAKEALEIYHNNHGGYLERDAIITCYSQDENGHITVINQTTETIELTN